MLGQLKCGELAKTVLNHQPLEPTHVNSILRVVGLMGGTSTRFLLDSGATVSVVCYDSMEEC